MAQNNTTRDGAWEATVGPTTQAYNSGLVSNAGYLRYLDGDADGSSDYRHAWWRYRPTAAGSTSVSANGSVPGAGAAIKLFIFKLAPGNVLNPVVVVSMTTVHNLTVTPGEVYYFVIEQNIDSVDSQYWLNVTGRLTAKPSNDEAFYRSTIIVDPGGGTFEAAPTPTDQLTISGADPNNGGALQNDAWWKITLASPGTVVFKPRMISGSATVYLTLYTHDAATDTYTWFDEFEAGSTRTFSGLAAGFRLFAQMVVWSVEDPTVTYRLSVTAPRCIEPDNHQYDDAYLVTFGIDRTYVGSVNTGTLLTAETAPPGISLQGTNGAWYKLRPATTGVYSSEAVGAAGAPGTYLGLYQLSSSGTWSTLQVKSLGDGGKLNSSKLFPGYSYYWRTSDNGAGTQNNTLTITQLPKAPHHQYANALPIQTDAPTEQQSVVVTPDWDVSDLSATETFPPGITLSGRMGIWYTYVPSASKNGFENPLEISAFSNDNTGVFGRITVYSVTNGVWTSVWFGGATVISDTAGPVIDSLSIVQGTRYYIRFWTPNTLNSVRLRFRYLPPPGVEGFVSPNNHQAVNATEIITQLDGTWAETHNNVNYDAAEVLPPGTSASGTQAMWWKFTPTASTPAGKVKFLAQSQTYGHTVLVYDSTVAPWVEVDSILVDTPSYPSSTSTSPALTAGVTYYYRVGNYRRVWPQPPDGAGQTMRLALQGAVPASVSDPLAVCPPIRVNTLLPTPVASAQADLIPPITVSVAAGAPVDYLNAVAPITVRVTATPPVSPEPPIVIPAITAHVVMPVGNNLYGTSVDPVRIRVRIGQPATAEASIGLSNPDPGQIVANFFPVFVVGLTAADDYAQYQIQIEYSADPSFATSTVVTLDAPVVDGGVDYTPTAPVPATTYWRARLLEGAEQVAPWTPSRSFEVRVVITSTTLPVTWTVSGVAARPIHLWHFEPAGVEEGDEVTLYGQGFTTTVGSLTIYGQPIAPLSWTLVPQNPLATPDDRVIDGDLVDPEHFAVTFIAPPVEEPGGPITVGA